MHHCYIKISIVIPAHNEEAFLPKSLAAIELAKKNSPLEIEIIVVLNRCTDGTEKIARDFGANLVYEDARNLAQIRNAGLAEAQGDILMTIDADSYMHPMTFADVVEKLDSRQFIGGGCLVLPERYSLGIFASMIVLFPHLAKHQVSFGCFWFTRAAYEATGGFDPTFITVEDVDFAVRLKRYGKTLGKRFGTLYRSRLTTSCRKFDKYGDWHMVKDPAFLKKVFEGKDRETGDRYWYEPDR